MARSSVVVGAPLMGRRLRRPSHTFNLRTRPWEIQPMLLAPVLPGESMQNLLLQSRVVTDPILNPLIGWWKEYYFFYVKHRDLYDRDLLVQMHLNPAADLSSLDSATAVKNYHTNGTELAIDWCKLCLERVVDEYFRNEGENFDDFAITAGSWAAGINNSNYLDSLIQDDTITQASAIDQNLVSAVAGQGDATTAVWTSEIEQAMRQYEFARFHKLTDQTFEDYCETFGVRMPAAEELHKPELIRFIREWSYPSNTIDPANGTPRSAVSWSIAERADKKRFFKEPGFIFGVTVTRPKLYMRNINSNAAMLMKTAQSWLPAVMSDDPWSSMVKVTAGDPPLDINTDAYWLDIKDLLLYGDQFVNFDLASVVNNIVALPSAAGQRRYASGTDADALFVAASPSNQIREDGVVSLTIAGRQVDTSPMSIGNNDTV